MRAPWLAPIFLGILGCGSTQGDDKEGQELQLAPLPHGVEPGTLTVTVTEAGRLVAAGIDVAGWPPARQDFRGDLHPALDKALEGQAQSSILIQVPSTTAFRDLQPLLHTADRRGMRHQWLPSLEAGTALGPFTRPTSPPEGTALTVTGARPHLVLSVSSRGSARWVDTSVAYEALATVEGATEPLGLRAGDLPGAVDCAAVFGEATPLVEACTAGQQPDADDPPPLQVGLETGCLVAPITDSAATDQWRHELAASIPALDLGAWGTPILALDPTVQTRTAVALALGIQDSGLSLPILAGRSGLDGSEGPTPCPTEVPSDEELAESGAYWLGRAGATAEAAALRAAAAPATTTEPDTQPVDDTVPPYDASLTEVTATGAISKRVAQTAVEESWEPLDSCFQNAARHGLSGAIRLEVAVKQSGKARSKVVRATPGLQAVGACLSGRVQRVPFPAEDEASTLTYDFRVMAL